MAASVADFTNACWIVARKFTYASSKADRAKQVQEAAKAIKWRAPGKRKK